MSSGGSAQPLPELAGVHWRPLASEHSLRNSGRLWTLSIFAQTVPFLAIAAFVAALKPVVAPLLAVALAYAWILPALYAARGANVLRPGAPRAGAARGVSTASAERAALGLLGDLLDHAARELHARTGFVVEPGVLGTWVLGQAGGVLVRPGGRRVHCYCVKASGPQLPAADRVAHLLLALRTDERGFATVANQAFSGARWRLRRRLAQPARAALDAAATIARESSGPTSFQDLCT